MVALFGKHSTSVPKYENFEGLGITKKLWVRRATDVADKQVTIDIHSARNPDKTLTLKFLKERPHSDKFWIKRDFSEMKFVDEEKPND